MPYVKTNWENFPSTSTALNAENLGNLERQYEEAISDVATYIGDPESDIGAAIAEAVAGGSAPVQYTFSHMGDVVVGTGTHRLYNDTGKTLTISTVRATVGTAPTGASIIVDVHKNDVTIFTTQADRPTIAVSTFTDTSTPAVVTWTAGQYLTVDIDQIGSTVVGANLTVTIVAS